MGQTTPTITSILVNRKEEIDSENRISGVDSLAKLWQIEVATSYSNLKETYIKHIYFILGYFVHKCEMFLFESVIIRFGNPLLGKL